MARQPTNLFSQGVLPLQRLRTYADTFLRSFGMCVACPRPSCVADRVPVTVQLTRFVSFSYLL